MAHVRDDEWIDLVRGTLPGDRAAEVMAHAEQGCASCLRSLALWRAAIEQISRDRAYTPPAYAVRMARSQFAALSIREPSSPLRALLVFDSFCHVPAAGVRGAAAAPRQLLYRAGALSIDLRVEWTGGPNHATVIGQVACRGTETEAARPYRVRLLDGDREVDATSTDRFGEFELRFALHGDLGLLITAPDGPAVRLELAEVVGGS